MALFGLTWLFAALTVTDSSVAFQVIFAICNTTQGFFIFLLYCVFSTKARQLWKEAFTQIILNKIRPRITPRVTTNTSHQLTARGGTQPSTVKTTGTSDDTAAETSVGVTLKPVEITGSVATDITIEKQGHAGLSTGTNGEAFIFENPVCIDWLGSPYGGDEVEMQEFRVRIFSNSS